MIVHAIILDEIKKYQCDCECHSNDFIMHCEACCNPGWAHERALNKTLKSVEDCHIIDVISYDQFDPVPFVKDKENTFVTFLIPEYPREKQINELVRGNPSDYVLLIESGWTVDNIVKRVDYYRKDNKLSMVEPSDGIRALIHSKTFNWLCGFSVKDDSDSESIDQSIVDKIKIMAKNHDQEYLILSSIEDFYAKTNDGLAV